MTTPKKKPAAKKKVEPVAKPAAARSCRRITEIYEWTGELHPQGPGLRFLEIRATDGSQTYRVMGIDDAVANTLVGMLHPEPTE